MKQFRLPGVEVGFGAVHPFGMMAQAGQTPDVLMEMSSEEVGHPVTQQAAEETQQQGFAQGQRAATGQRRNGKQQYRARHDKPGDGQAFHAGDDKHRDRQPFGVQC
jgi:hypothetical protein